jgi:hypothetical protein
MAVAMIVVAATATAAIVAIVAVIVDTAVADIAVAEVIGQFMYGAIPVAMGHTLDHITDHHQGVAAK